MNRRTGQADTTEENIMACSLLFRASVRRDTCLTNYEIIMTQKGEKYHA